MTPAEGSPETPHAQEQRLLAFCDDVIARAKRRGAGDVEVYAEAVRQVAANVEQNQLKGASAAEHEAVGIRLFVDKPDGKALGFAYVNRMDPASLDEAIDDAIAIAKASPGDPSNGLVGPQPAKEIPGLYDPRIAALGADDVARQAKVLLDRARKRDKRVSVDNGSTSATAAHAAIRSSAGVSAASSETALSWGLFGMAIDGDDVGSFDSEYDASRTFAGMDLHHTADTFAARALSVLRPKNGKNKKGRVLFSAEAFEEIFLDVLLSAVDGDTVLRGKSRLKDKLGARIASAGLFVVDDGTVPGGIGSASFDREGVPHRRTVIVGDGELHAFLYDGKTARRAHRRPSGHAQGSARSLPGIGTTNITVKAGGTSEAQLLKELGEGLLVQRFSGDTDGVSGDFSGVAKGSFWVGGGEKRFPVKETLIAGNAFVGLEHIVAIGDVLHRNMSTQAPWVLIDGVDVTAGS